MSRSWIGRSGAALVLAGFVAACSGGGTSDPPRPAPTIASVSPTSGAMAGGTVVAVTGTGFDVAAGATTVTIGGSAATAVSVSSSTSLTCAAPAGAAGPADVVVTTSSGSATLAQGFTYLRPVPTVASVSPASGAMAGGTVITLTGTGFDTAAGGTTVMIGGTAATAVTVASENLLTCAAPAGNAGPADVVVTTSGGSATLTQGFTYLRPVPTISSISPTSGGVEGGTVVAVTGTDFDTAAGGTTVTIGGAAATAVNVTSSTSLTCATPTGTAGPADVVVSTSGGTATLAGGFTFLGPYLFAALMNDLSGQCGFWSSPSARVEIVDLASNAMAVGFDLPGTSVTSLAVSPDGQRIFLSDFCNNQVHVYSPQGAKVTDLPVAGPRDLALSADGSTLYVATYVPMGPTNSLVAAFDTSTFAPAGSVALDPWDYALGMGLSPDGAYLAAASGGTGPAVYLLSTSPLALIQRVPITATIPGCGVSPNDVTFTDEGRVLAWDSNCDWLYQVDVATRSYLSGSDVAYARDSGSSSNYNNAIFFVPATGKAYGFNEARQAVVSDPATPSGTTLGGFDGSPLVPAPRPEGSGVYYSVVHRFSGGGADTLDLLDTGTGTFARGTYTFSDATRSVRDMRMVRIPGL